MAKVYILPDQKKASLFICETLIRIWPEIKMFGFATGGTPQLLYGLLIQAYQDGKISFKDICTINLDEYIGMHPNHPQSYAKYLKDIYCQVDIDMQKNRFPTCLIDSHDEIVKTCCRMEEWIQKHGPVTVWILGMGKNGHMAFIEPFPTVFFDQRRHYHVAVLSLSTREANKRFFDNKIELVSIKAITAGINTIKEGKHLIQLAFGPEKEWAVTFSVLGPMTGLVPSSLLQDHSDWVLMVDQEAGTGILEYIRDQRIHPNDEGFYELTSEAGKTHLIKVAREVSSQFSLETRTLAEKVQDLR